MRTSWSLVGAVLVVSMSACAEDVDPASLPASTPLPVSPQPAEWQAVSVAEARVRLEALGTDTLTIIDKRAVGAGLYRRAAGAEPHPFVVAQNAVYHVLEGEADLVVGSDTARVTRATTAFVRGREARSFQDVAEDLLVLAMYTNARPGLDDPLLSVYSRDELLRLRNPNQNILYRVVAAQSMTVGSFMLPREIGGDLLVRHGVDELKYVIRGGGTLEAGPDVVPVEAGFVVFVDGSLTHRFTRLWRDLDVLFVWGR